MEKKKFHITWFDNEEDLRSKGENFLADDECDAIRAFRKKYPTAIFLSCISSEVLDLKVRQG